MSKDFDQSPLARLLGFLDELELHAQTGQSKCRDARTIRDQKQARVQWRQEETLQTLKEQFGLEKTDLEQKHQAARAALDRDRSAKQEDLDRKFNELEATIETKARRQEERSARGIANQQWEAAVSAETAQNRIEQDFRDQQRDFAEREHHLERAAEIIPARSPASRSGGPPINLDNLDAQLQDLVNRNEMPWTRWIIFPLALLQRSRAWLRAPRDLARLEELRAQATEIFTSARREHDLAISQLQAEQDRNGPRSGSVPSVASSRRKSLERLEVKFGENVTKLTAWHQSQQQALDQQFQRQLAAATARHERAVNDLNRNTQHEVDQAQDDYARVRGQILMDWNDHQHQAFLTTLATLEDLGHQSPLDWSDDYWTSWHPSPHASGVAALATLPYDFAAVLEPFTAETGCSWDGPRSASLPVLLGLPRQASIMIEYEPDQRAAALAAGRSLLLRLLAAIPPGKSELTLIDPVGLGETFAAFMHLADVDEGAMLRRVHSEPRQIEEQLLNLTDHMQDVIQTYLRNEFETIDDYNRHAGQIAEPYRFLVMADFPVNLSEEGVKRLLSIIRSGARCGVYAILLRDLRRPFPPDLHERDLHHTLASIRCRGSQWQLQPAEDPDARRGVQLGGDLPDALTNEMLHAIRDAAESTHHVEVPFRVIKPTEREVWTGSTAKELRVALGPSGANRSQMLRLGRGTAQHVLVAGKTGSGKSTLMHILITNLALWFSPDEIEFYLIDFKKGVEFQLYDVCQLPHARVIAIESDREFGLSVLKRIDEELKRRGELFRQLGVQDMAGYRAASPDPLPRTMLIVDEFQEIFTEDDQVTQEASLILDRLVRQGRAFGMHTLLGSQTLDGVYSLARSTMGQMGVRIALQCAEADSYLILSEDNPHARMLSRPGDAIYNDAGGKLEGNSHFQVAWLDEAERRTCLDMVAQRAQDEGRTAVPFVFRGHVPATLEHCRPLTAALAEASPSSEAPTVWIGDSVTIEPPASLTFPRQSGANVLILGQSESAAAGLIESMMLALAAQIPVGDDVSFYVCDGFGKTAGRLGQLGEALPHRTEIVDEHSLPETMNRLGQELSRRLEDPRGSYPPRYLLLGGLQAWRALRRREDDFSFSSDAGPPKPDAILASLLRDGPLVGLHVVTWVDTVNNLSRFLDRRSQGEFENRILFQMSQTDSSQIIDSTAAGRLGPHRALVHREERGTIQKFRPWAAADLEWLVAQAQQLRP